MCLDSDFAVRVNELYEAKETQHHMGRHIRIDSTWLDRVVVPSVCSIVCRTAIISNKLIYLPDTRWHKIGRRVGGRAARCLCG